MQVNSFIIVNLYNPTERFVGRLVEIGTAGVTVRGVDLGAFEAWMRDIAENQQQGIRPSTVFFPLKRVEKIILDEDLGEIPSLANTFLARVGTSIELYLG